MVEISTLKKHTQFLRNKGAFEDCPTNGGVDVPKALSQIVEALDNVILDFVDPVLPDIHIRRWEGRFLDSLSPDGKNLALAAEIAQTSVSEYLRLAISQLALSSITRYLWSPLSPGKRYES